MNPYRVEATPEAPVVTLSFSGGRTSGYMLWHVLDAFDGRLPDYYHVVFCNTGLEMEETLKFVDACSRNWNVPIWWLEYRAGKTFALVDFTTASRKGEPFDALLTEPVARNDGTRGVRPLPNPVSRICTVNLKTRLKKRTLQHFYGKGVGYHSIIGFRADEGNRVARGFKYPEPNEVLHYPMHAAGATLQDVLAFWRDQPFDLGLPLDTHGLSVEGNCDLCFMKSARKVSAIAQRHPERAAWWAAAEARAQQSDRPSTFRNDRPDYATILAAATTETPVDYGIFDDLTSCGSHGCTD